MDDLPTTLMAARGRAESARLTCLKLLTTLLSLLLYAGAVSAYAADANGLWAQYQAAMGQAYADAASSSTWPAARDPQHLLDLLNKSPVKQTPAIVIANKSTLLAHVEQPETQTLVARLLQQDAYQIAEEIQSAADETGDRYLRSKINYEFARYHLSRGEWDECQQQLDRDVFNNALTSEEKDYASIMRGMLLQRRSKHRAAIPFYSEVPSTSPHYPTAQLNLATAYIRQDWWTDAHRAIRKALKGNKDKVLQDRLYTTLGFSQLQKEFYRDSRESFRRVRADSPYSVRALFGLGMAALHQGDYPGALNAFRLLKQMGTYEKSVVESYLMLPMTLERMGQVGAASAGFNEAIAYYENYALELEQNLLELRQSPNGQTMQTAEKLSFLDLTPASVTLAITKLHEAQQLPTSEMIQQTLGDLLSDYETLRSNLAVIKLEKNHEIVQHYLNQARFGLARLHDTSNREDS